MRMFNNQAIQGSTSRLSIVDHSETYGRHILENAIKKLDVEFAIDLGCGSGNDLEIVQSRFPHSRLLGIDFGNFNEEILKSKNIPSIALNIENEKLPFENNSIDLIIANQFLEHTKEIFWINHEVFRTLKVGGYFFFGTPNVVSLHNRILMLMGKHPTQHKMTSAHVRPFSKHDVEKFYSQIASEFTKIEGFWGSQFYPFPKSVARAMANVLPNMAFSIFFLVKKTSEYQSEFVKWPRFANLETNFFVG